MLYDLSTSLYVWLAVAGHLAMLAVNSYVVNLQAIRACHKNG
jgi:hypothetical protein